LEPRCMAASICSAQSSWPAATPALRGGGCAAAPAGESGCEEGALAATRASGCSRARSKPVLHPSNRAGKALSAHGGHKYRAGIQIVGFNKTNRTEPSHIVTGTAGPYGHGLS
jgi:hypothetical protein